MKIDRQLAQVFDAELVEEPEVITSDNRVLPPEDNSEEYDFQKVRDNLHTLMDYGNEGLEFALQVARESENPRAIEVFSNMIKNLSDLNISLMDVHDKRKKIKREKGETTPTAQNITKNQVFVGTTKELKNFIQEMKDKDIDDGTT